MAKRHKQEPIEEVELESYMDDAYTSVESMLYEWFADRDLCPGKLGRGDLADLAVKVSRCIEPFRSFFRATEGWDGYDLEEQRARARKAEKKL